MTFTTFWHELSREQRRQVESKWKSGRPRRYSYEIGSSGEVLWRQSLSIRPNYSDRKLAYR